MPNLLRTPLHVEHERLGARTVDFAGWEMPVQYRGIIHESKAVRESAGMFDVSHMGRTWFRGPGALQFLEATTTNDVAKLENGGSQYSLLCYENGTCVDDIIVYRVSETEFRMVVNASNRERDLDWLRSHNEQAVEISDETLETAMVAVQGPRAVDAIASLFGAGVKDVPKFHAANLVRSGVGVFAARTGYTGEDGFELMVTGQDAAGMWRALLDAGVEPCGLAARDVLRVEAGLPLYGHELSDKINPIESGLGWVCSKTKKYLGSDAINAMRAEGPKRKLMGIAMDTKMVPRESYPVIVDGAVAGEMSSGVYSPVLERGIGFAFIDAAHSQAERRCEVVVREKPQRATIVSKRFLKKQAD